MDKPYDLVTPTLERTTDKTGRRGADWRLGLTRKPLEADAKHSSTNVEWMTTDELRELRATIDRALLQDQAVNPESRRIDSRAELVELARELRVRNNWHEPDEQEVTARVHGDSFDNAGFWGHWKGTLDTFGAGHQEMWVELFQDGIPVAEINLATLFAYATGYED